MSPILSQAPPLWRLRQIEPAKASKVLIVGANYPMLTCKIDPVVKFWTANRAKKDPSIPTEVTILWVADDLDSDIRTSLLDQAIKRNIEIWWAVGTRRAFSIRRLCEKLFDLWGDPSNRSLVEVVGENESTIRDGSPTRVDELKAAAERYRKGINLKFDRPLPLKVRGRPRLAREPELSNTEAPLTALPAEALARIADYEKDVYLFYLQCAGANGDRLSRAAGRFHLKEANARLLIERVERKLCLQG